MLADLTALPMVTAAVLLLEAFAFVSIFDGVYVHLWRYRLFERADSRREHWLHTVRAVLFAPIVLLVFAAPTAGAALYAGVALVAIDQLAEILDVLEERRSRATLGGLPSGEYLLHAILVTLRAAAVALALAARPAEAWAWSAPATVGAYPDTIALIAGGLVPPALAIAAIHVWLGLRRPAPAPAT